MMNAVAISVACAPLIAQIKNISSTWKLMDILQTLINLRINMEKKKFKEECCIFYVSLRRSFHLKGIFHNNDFKLQALLRVQVIRYTQKVSAKWPLLMDTARVYTFTNLCWNSRRHITLNRWKEYVHTEHIHKHSSDIHIKSVNHYFQRHNNITDKRPVTAGRPTASYLNLSLCCR
jgi:hypothetical protein